MTKMRSQNSKRKPNWLRNEGLAAGVVAGDATKLSIARTVAVGLRRVERAIRGQTRRDALFVAVAEVRAVEQVVELPVEGSCTRSPS